MASSKRVAIIGAGSSGLSAIKACKEENLEPVCFERNEELGGLWRYHDEDIEGVASVMKTTIINTSKEASAFSDFPPPKEFPNYMHNRMLHRYFLLYAEHFDLVKHIRYHSEVLEVSKADDYEKTGRWSVAVRNLKSEEVTKEVFDAVMICIGHHVYPKIPTFPDQEKFRGTILHSHSVKSCEGFSGKTVVVVGIGNSGVDVAVDSSYVAKQVYLSTRRGSWILSRLGKNGWPFDLSLGTRWTRYLSSFKSFDRVCAEREKKINEWFDHEAYNLKPKHRYFSAHPTMNESLPNCILSGRIIVKGDVKRFEENGIVFDGDDGLTECDVVVLATGYLIKFPFLTEVVTVKDNRVHLYQYVFPTNVKHSTLGFIGLIQPLGSIIPISEIQSRWFVQVLKNNVSLPPPEEMEKHVKAKNEANAKRYVDSTRHTIQVDWVTFMDEIAKEIGAKPNLWKLAMNDPKLFLACVNGPCLSYQYRLFGPHSWPGAREAILDYKSRVFAPLNKEGKAVSLDKKQPMAKIVFVCFLSSAAFLCLSKYSQELKGLWK